MSGKDEQTKWGEALGVIAIGYVPVVAIVVAGIAWFVR